MAGRLLDELRITLGITFKERVVVYGRRKKQRGAPENLLFFFKEAKKRYRSRDPRLEERKKTQKADLFLLSELSSYTTTTF